MPRTARAIVGGYCYHLINRGNNQACVFHEHADYAAFMSLVAETQQRIFVPILAACLMPNHLHLSCARLDRKTWHAGRTGRSRRTCVAIIGNVRPQVDCGKAVSKRS
jgi:hypothetical protein